MYGNSSVGNSENIHPRLRVTVRVENCSGKDEGKVGLLKKSMHGTTDASSNWERDARASGWGRELGQFKKSVSKQETENPWV